MLLDLLSSDNQMSFNVKLAHMIGLQGAVYVSTLISINSKAFRKQVIYDGYFNVDRKWVAHKTTLSVEEQLKLDAALSKLNIICVDKDNCDKLKLDIDILANYVTDENISEKDVKQIVCKNLNSPNSANEVQLVKLKKYITTTNAELRDAYSRWIETILGKYGWMSAQAVIKGQSVVDKFANHDLDKALELIHIADMNGYRDMSWATNANSFKDDATEYINVYSKIYLSQSTIDYLNENYSKEAIQYVYSEISAFCASKNITYNDTNVLKWFNRCEESGKISKMKKKPQMVSIL